MFHLPNLFNIFLSPGRDVSIDKEKEDDDRDGAERHREMHEGSIIILEVILGFGFIEEERHTYCFGKSDYLYIMTRKN